MQSPRDIRGLHGIRWAGLPSHLSGMGFFGQAIEPLRRPFFRELACAFCVSLGWRIQAKLSNTFTLLLMISERTLGAQGRSKPESAAGLGRATIVGFLNHLDHASESTVFRCWNNLKIVRVKQRGWNSSYPIRDRRGTVANGRVRKGTTAARILCRKLPESRRSLAH